MKQRVKPEKHHPTQSHCFLLTTSYSEREVKVSEQTTKSVENIIIIIALKGVIRDFLQSPHCTANPLQHVRSSGPGAIMCRSHATSSAYTRATSSAYHMQHVVIHATWYEGTAQLLSLTQLKSHLFEVYFIG